MHRSSLVVLRVSLLSGAAAGRRPRRAAAPEEVLLWPNGAPGSEGKTAPEVVDARRRRPPHLQHPQAVAHAPTCRPRRAATGAAVIILPGGGHRYLSIDNEGHAVARWLSEHGVAALRAQVPPGARGGLDLQGRGSTPWRTPSGRCGWCAAGPRSGASIPQRVGLLGFSAGGAAGGAGGGRASTPARRTPRDPVERESSRPAFQALLYPGGAEADAAVAQGRAARRSCCVASDDKGPDRERAGRCSRSCARPASSAELHVYAKGGHGFGMKDRPLPITGWPARFREWLGDQGFLKPPPPRQTVARPAGGGRRLTGAWTGAHAALLPRAGGAGVPAQRRDARRRARRWSAASPRRCGRSSTATASSCHGGEKPEGRPRPAPLHARWTSVVAGPPALGAGAREAGGRRRCRRRRPSSSRPPRRAQQVIDWIAARAQARGAQATPAIRARCWRGG